MNLPTQDIVIADEGVGIDDRHRAASAQGIEANDHRRLIRPGDVQFGARFTQGDRTMVVPSEYLEVVVTRA